MQLCRLLHVRRVAGVAHQPLLLEFLLGTQQQQQQALLGADAATTDAAASGKAAAWTVMHRCFAAGAASGPLDSKIRAVPFTVTPFEATQTFDEHHAKSWLHKRPSGGIASRATQLCPAASRQARQAAITI